MAQAPVTPSIRITLDIFSSFIGCLRPFDSLAQVAFALALCADLLVCLVVCFFAGLQPQNAASDCRQEGKQPDPPLKAWAAKRNYETPTIDWPEVMLPEESERVRELTAEEEDRLFAALPDNLKPIVEFALLSGQRRTEIISLRWSDVNLAEARASFSIKGGDKHSIPLSPRMVALIANQPKVCPQVFTYVCQRPAPKRKDRPQRVKGERYPFSKQGWARQWRKALKEAGIENYRFHDNRHTAATRNLRASGNMKGVQKLLGHKDLRTTGRYAHAMEDDVRAMLFATESRNSPEPQDNDLPQTRRNARSGDA